MLLGRLWGGVFLEEGLVNFLPVSTVSTSWGVHVCVHSFVFTFAFSGAQAGVDPDVGSPKTLNSFCPRLLII